MPKTWVIIAPMRLDFLSVQKAQQMRDYLAKLGLPFNTNHTEH